MSKAKELIENVINEATFVMPQPQRRDKVILEKLAADVDAKPTSFFHARILVKAEWTFWDDLRLGEYMPEYRTYWGAPEAAVAFIRQAKAKLKGAYPTIGKSVPTLTGLSSMHVVYFPLIRKK